MSSIASSSVYDSGLLVGQINLHKSHIAKMELELQQFDLCLVQEPPRVARGGATAFSGYKAFFAPATSPRAAIYVRSHYHAFLVQEYCNKDLAVVALKTEMGLAYVASSYHDILLPTISAKLEALARRCMREGTPLLVVV